MIEKFAALLLNDLMFSAPEMWETHIKRRMEELVEAVSNEKENT